MTLKNVAIAAGFGLMSGVLVLTMTGPAQAQTSQQDPWIVGLGDSFMSGEGGRWASNSLSRTGTGWQVGDLSEVYGEPNGESSLRYCHRAESSPSHINGGWQSLNLACSGAQLDSVNVTEPQRSIPGLDTTGIAPGVQGQLQDLSDFAAHNDVQAVVVSIGGNDLGFSTIISDCVSRFMTWGWACAESLPDSIADLGEPGSLSSRSQAVSAGITDRLTRINDIMAATGKGPGDWTLIVQLPPNFVADSKRIAYSEGYERQWDGGVGFYDADLDLFRTRLQPVISEVMSSATEDFRKANPAARVIQLDTSGAFDGHALGDNRTVRLAENDAGTGEPEWESTGRYGEWARTISLADQLGGTWDDAQENAHPNYWGQRALSECVTQALSWGGAATTLACTPVDGPLTSRGTPQMSVDAVPGEVGWQSQSKASADGRSYSPVSPATTYQEHLLAAVDAGARRPDETALGLLFAETLQPRGNRTGKHRMQIDERSDATGQQWKTQYTKTSGLAGYGEGLVVNLHPDFRNAQPGTEKLYRIRTTEKADFEYTNELLIKVVYDGETIRWGLNSADELFDARSANTMGLLLTEGGPWYQGLVNLWRS